MMPSNPLRLRFLALALVAGAAACSVRQGAGALPPSQAPGLSFAPATAAPGGHAPCAVPRGYAAPLAGTLGVVTAFGELEENPKTGIRWAARGVDLAAKAGQTVHAAQTGRLRYVAQYPPYGKSAILTAKGGAQTLYANLMGKSIPPPRTIKKGEALGKASGPVLHFEITDSTGLNGGARAQLNPCGSSDGATGTISILPASPSANVVFATLSLDSVPLPTQSPGGNVTTPATLTVSKVVPPHNWAWTPYQYGALVGSYYIVLCGNVVFQSGNARSTVLIPGSGTVPKVPPLVFFRDAGKRGADLTAPLPSPYPRGCPAPAPVSGSYSNWTFNQVGQTAWAYWSDPAATAGETVTMTVVASPPPVSITPNPAPVDVTPPPYPPPPGSYYTVTAIAVGTSQITNVNSNGVTLSPITVTVNPTPTPAPVPTPMPNTMPSASPTPTASPTATPTP